MSLRLLFRCKQESGRYDGHDARIFSSRTHNMVTADRHTQGIGENIIPDFEMMVFFSSIGW
jgi:hypothetical protein